jgi:2'-hydroxyisoflavone reductase
VLENKDQEEITNETLRADEGGCEQSVRDAYGTRSSIVRPGYIVGPLDPTDRFTYWPVRFAEGRRHGRARARPTTRSRS